MVHYLDGNILIAFRNKLIYVDLTDQKIDTVESSPNVIEVEISSDNIDFVQLHHLYKIIAIQEIGLHATSILIEDLKSRQIRFLRV